MLHYYTYEVVAATSELVTSAPCVDSAGGLQEVTAMGEAQ